MLDSRGFGGLKLAYGLETGSINDLILNSNISWIFQLFLLRFGFRNTVGLV